MKAIIDMMAQRKNKTSKEVKRLLEINGDTINSKSIFDRLHISPNLDFEKIMEFEFDDDEFAETIPSLSAAVGPDGRISYSTNPLDLLLRNDMKKIKGPNLES